MEHCPEISRDAAKSFVNSCIGIGKEGIQQWCREHDCATLPRALAEYLDDIRKVIDKDVEDHPELVQKLRGLGKDDRELSMALTYSLNSVYERKTNAAAMERCKDLAIVRCDELDGLFLERLHGHTWPEIENALGDVCVHKPYRARCKLLQALQAEVGIDKPKSSSRSAQKLARARMEDKQLQQSNFNETPLARKREMQSSKMAAQKRSLSRSLYDAPVDELGKCSLNENEGLSQNQHGFHRGEDEQDFKPPFAPSKMESRQVNCDGCPLKEG